jgi:hypothetical protein
MVERCFTIFLTSGIREVITATENDTIATAFLRSGYPEVSAQFVAFYKVGDNDEYEFNPKSKQWDRKDMFSKLKIAA